MGQSLAHDAPADAWGRHRRRRVDYRRGLCTVRPRLSPVAHSGRTIPATGSPSTGHRSGWLLDRRGRRWVVGEAIATRRERLWMLSSYAVLPDAQDRGIGRALLERALTYAEGCVRGMIVSSPDARAARRYRLAGFSLHPMMHADGTVERAALPFVDHVRPGTIADLALLESVDRQVRGASHGADHRLLGGDHATTGLRHVPRQWIRVRARRLARRCSPPRHVESRTSCCGRCWRGRRRTSEVNVRNITVENEWALDIGLAAGLAVETSGYLCLRGMRPPAPYVPSGAYL